MGEKVRQGDEKAKNFKRSLVMYHKHRETAVDVQFERGTKMLIHGPERSSTYWNGFCNSS